MGYSPYSVKLDSYNLISKGKDPIKLLIVLHHSSLVRLLK